MIYLEIMAYKNYNARDFEVSFWRTYEKHEVDFVLGDTLGDAQVAIEVKSGKSVKNDDLKGLDVFVETYKPKKAFVVCNTDTPRKLENGVVILPYRLFLDKLWGWEVL